MILCEKCRLFTEINVDVIIIFALKCTFIRQVNLAGVMINEIGNAFC